MSNSYNLPGDSWTKEDYDRILNATHIGQTLGAQVPEDFLYEAGYRRGLEHQRENSEDLRRCLRQCWMFLKILGNPDIHECPNFSELVVDVESTLLKAKDLR